MARRARLISNPQVSSDLENSLKQGAFAPEVACRVIRSLRGWTQEELAIRLEVNVKLVKALESGKGNLRFSSLEKIASAVGLRVAFVDAKSQVDLLDPAKRSSQERRRRMEDARSISEGIASEASLRKRNALQADDVVFDLPTLS